MDNKPSSCKDPENAEHAPVKENVVASTVPKPTPSSTYTPTAAREKQQAENDQIQIRELSYKLEMPLETAEKNPRKKKESPNSDQPFKKPGIVYQQKRRASLNEGVFHSFINTPKESRHNKTKSRPTLTLPGSNPVASLNPYPPLNPMPNASSNLCPVSKENPGSTSVSNEFPGTPPLSDPRFQEWKHLIGMRFGPGNNFVREKNYYCCLCHKDFDDMEPLNVHKYRQHNLKPENPK